MRRSLQGKWVLMAPLGALSQAWVSARASEYTKQAAGGLGVLAAAVMALATWLEYSQTRARFQPDPTQPDPFTALLLIGLGGPIVCFLASVAGGWGPVNREGAAGALFAVGAWLLWSTGWRMGLPVDTGWSVLSAAGAIVAIIAGTLFSLSRTPGKIERPRSETTPQPPAEGSPAIIDLDSGPTP